MKVVDTCETKALSPETFARFAQFITAELGIKMPDSKLTMVQSRLLRRVRELGLNSVEKYGDFFFTSTNTEEREHFINAITTNKTDFFREPQHFEYLARVVLPSLNSVRERRRGDRMKVWSAGCSSGEEVYTLAMVLNEYALQHQGFEYALLGTDISTKVLDQARIAIYQESQVLPVPVELRRKYIWRSRSRDEQLARIVPELRRTATFDVLNLMDEEYGITDLFDIIFFRNVLIYFDRSTQEAVINKLCRHLARGGYFFAGHSESLTGLAVPLSCVNTSVFRKAA